jgi:hypothetical protein
MCQTTDPVTGVKDHGALIRFSVINGLNPTEILLDQLVAPLNPITESRTHIHGIYLSIYLIVYLSNYLSI